MLLDTHLLGRIVATVVGGVVVALILRTIERRVRLVAYYGHVGGEFHIQPIGTNPAFLVRTHSIVIKNTGGLPAHNVRVPHRVSFSASTVNVSISLGVNYTASTLPGGADETVFPILVPGQEVTMSYLYLPPLTWNQINLPITCDEGMARVLSVLPTRQLTRWQLWLLRILVAIGALTALYFIALAARFAF
jgi:hypothetical protein